METRDVIIHSNDQANRFSLRQMFGWMIVVALMCAPVAYVAMNPSVVMIAWTGLGIIILLRVARKLSIVESLVLAFVLCLIVSLLLPAVNTPNYGRRRAQCSNNLKQISLALLNYHTEQGSFPPAYIADEKGVPMHSWRVLILPYLEQTNLYEQYDFSEPWDGPNNSLLHNHVVSLFGCPSDTSTANNTNYVAVVGPDTAWPGAEGRSIEQIKDGTTNTILVVEVHDSGIHWMEPRDLDFATASTTINQGPPGRMISSNHGPLANVAFADGSVRFLSDDTPGATVRAMLTVDGGEEVDLNDLRVCRHIRHPVAGIGRQRTRIPQKSANFPLPGV